MLIPLKNTAVKTILLAHRFDHVILLFASLLWLPILYPISHKLLVNIFKALPGLSPPCLSVSCRWSPSIIMMSASTTHLLSFQTGTFLLSTILPYTLGRRSSQTTTELPHYPPSNPPRKFSFALMPPKKYLTI